MIYTIRHVTRYHYQGPVRESVMEVRKHPLNNGTQRCLNFHLTVEPEARVFRYQDYLGNVVHHFDIPWAHQDLSVTAEAVVEVKPEAERGKLPKAGSWKELDAEVTEADYYDMLLPSRFVPASSRLDQLAEELELKRRKDPFSTLSELNQTLGQVFAYDRQATRVDSSIDEVLERRRGAAQDFTHVMLGLARKLGVPARYVSGYLFRPESQQSPRESSHAWAELLIPGRGWVGFDPTHHCLAGECHVRTCIGRDYSDVPPTRGVYKGGASSELSFAVQVHLPEEPLEEDRFQTLR